MKTCLLLIATLLATTGFAQAQIIGTPGPAQPYVLAQNNFQQDFYRGTVTEVRIVRQRQEHRDRYDERDGRYPRDSRYEQEQPPERNNQGNDLMGAVIGGVVGGLAGNALSGNSKLLGTVIGAGAGAYVGTQVQERYSAPQMLQLQIRRDDGGVSVVTQAVDSNVTFNRGDVVTVLSDNSGIHAVK